MMKFSFVCLPIASLYIINSLLGTILLTDGIATLDEEVLIFL